MPYEKTHWEKKIAHRSDMSSQLVHLTRSTVADGTKVGPVDVLTKILLEQRITASDTDSGFIVGGCSRHLLPGCPGLRNRTEHPCGGAIP